MSEQPSTARAKRYAHEVVPPCTGEGCTVTRCVDGGPAEHAAAYHAARAYAFGLGADNAVAFNGARAAEVLTNYVMEYQLAHLWFMLRADEKSGDVQDLDDLALDIVGDLAAPHVLLPNAATFCEVVNVDWTSLRPYVVEDLT